MWTSTNLCDSSFREAMITKCPSVFWSISQVITGWSCNYEFSYLHFWNDFNQRNRNHTSWRRVYHALQTGVYDIFITFPRDSIKSYLQLDGLMWQRFDITYTCWNTYPSGTPPKVLTTSPAFVEDSPTDSFPGGVSAAKFDNHSRSITGDRRICHSHFTTY